jgi:glutathione S-transferase
VLGFSYQHDTRSVFGDFDSMRQTNPLGRIPSLVLDGEGGKAGEVLIDSAAILDWLDQEVGPERALVPAAGPERRRALRVLALACGAVDKAGAATYERVIRPAEFRWPEWIARCRTQAEGAVAALEAEFAPGGHMAGGGGAEAPLDQAQITTACLLRYLQMTNPDLLPPGRYPALEALSRRCEARPEFQATYPPDVVYPAG